MSDIKFGSVKMGSAVVNNTLTVGGGIRVGSSSVGGNIRIGQGGSVPAEARWGQIEGNIENQTDLMNSLATKADSSDLANYATTEQLATKMDSVSGSNGQFMSLVNGVWTAVDLPTYEGGVN